MIVHVLQLAPLQHVAYIKHSICKKPAVLDKFLLILCSLECQKNGSIYVMLCWAFSAPLVFVAVPTDTSVKHSLEMQGEKKDPSNKNVSH